MKNEIKEVNYGILTEKQENELDIKLDEVFSKVYIFDPQPSYQLKRNEKNEVIAEYENGFEYYLPILEVF